MTTRTLHRSTGLVLLVFIALHFATHLFALGGPEAHNAALKAVQPLYRNPVVEPLLVLAIVVQIVLGGRLAVRNWRIPGKSGWAKLQMASGLYLAYFMLNHTGAALFTRYLGGLETNFAWVSGPLFHPVMKPFFYPYYALAILAVASHAGAALHYAGKIRTARAMPVAGLVLVIAYWGSFGGWFYPVTPDPVYRAYYDRVLNLLF